MNDNDERLKLNLQKAQYFFDNFISVHISKIDKEWLNGEIKEQPSMDFLMLQEKKKGLIPVFFLEIFDIEKLEEER